MHGAKVKVVNFNLWVQFVDMYKQSFELKFFLERFFTTKLVL
jgi:hypothetical protein